MEWTYVSLQVDLKSEFKDVVLYCLDELLGLPYIDGKLEMSSF